MSPRALLGAVGTLFVMACSSCGEEDGRAAPGGGGTPSTGGASTGGTTPSGGGPSGGGPSGGGAPSTGGAGPDGGTPEDGGSDASAEAGPPACPTFGAGVPTGKVVKAAITEASGIVESRKTAGVFFVHNDSGDSARVFAIGEDGKDLGTYVFGGAGAVDWEDIALGPGPKAGENYLYAGDIGDNPSTRPDVKIYRVAEPKVDPTAAPTTITLSGVETFTLKYPDGAHNAETLLVDPLTSDLFIVVKADGTSPVFRAKAPLSSAGPMTMELVATLVFGSGALPGGKATTGGDISAAGDLIAVRTYGSAFAWRRTAGTSVGDAFAGAPCPIPLEQEPQGEALGFLADGSGYVTLSEGTSQPLYRFSKQ